MNPNFFMTKPLPAAVLEKIVLHKSRELFPSKRPLWKNPQVFNMARRSSVYSDNQPQQQQQQPLDNTNPELYNTNSGGRGGSSCWNNKKLWWSPPEDNLAVEFCRETSIHGLKFVAHRQSHIAERIFWVIAFCLGLIAAILLINEVWNRYYSNPVIVTFEPKEQDIDGLSFPSVTICNINKFTKSTVEELVRIAREGSETDPYGEHAKKHLGFVGNICNAQLSFAKEFNYAASRGLIDLEALNATISEDEQDDLIHFLLTSTTSCREMMRLCMFGEKIYPCNQLFTPLITDYGKCCTFNILPYPLLMNDPRSNETIIENDEAAKLTAKNWPKAEIDLWKLWKYSDGVILQKGLERPRRQTRAGQPYGLSVLLDANVDEYFCPASDSEGLRISLHTPLELPHVTEFANIIPLGKEIYVEVNPEVINADDNVKAYQHADRRCYFPEEKNLTFFKPYTETNCLDECTANVITQNCSCSYFYMPRYDGTKVCNTAAHSKDAKCIDNARIGLLGTLSDVCGHCDGLCENIHYYFQTTTADLQDPSKIWADAQGNATVQKWANNKMSIVHIFYGSDTTVPKLRTRLYGPVDLIASTGGLVGLCLGVSVLSAVEAVYYFTIRVCFKFCRKRHDQGQHQALITQFANTLRRKNKTTTVNSSSTDKSITLNPNMIPLYATTPKYSPNNIPSISINDGFPLRFGHPHQS